MAEVEVEAPSTAPEQQQQPRERRPIVYDESLLIKVKGKVKAPKEPDSAEKDHLIESLKAEIAKSGDRIAEIKQLIESKRNSRAAAFSGNSEAVKSLAAVRNEFQNVLRQKQHIREDFQNCNRQRDAMRNEIRSLREKMPRGTPANQVETRLQELEFKLQHESLGEQEEKRLQQQLQQLNAAKPLARQLVALDQKLKESDEQRAAISKRLADCDKVLTELKTKEEAERAALDQTKSKQEEGSIDIPALQQEKKALWDMMQEFRNKITEVQKEFSTKWHEYKQQDRAYKGYLLAEKQRKWEERQKEREARDAERAANEDAAAGVVSVVEPGVQVYDAEVASIDQLLTYLRSLVPKEDSKEDVQQKDVKAPEPGMVLFKRKDENDEFYGSVQKQKKQPAKKESKPAVPAKKNLQHSLDTLKTFMSLKVEVPLTVGEIPATIEKVEKKRVEVLERQEKAKNQPRAAPPAEVNDNASSSNGPAGPGVDVTLQVDKVTQSVSMKLRVSDA